MKIQLKIHLKCGKTKFKLSVLYVLHTIPNIENNIWTKRFYHFVNYSFKYFIEISLTDI